MTKPSDEVDSWLLERLVSPHDGAALDRSGRGLRCVGGHTFPVVQGVPMLLRDDVDQTIGPAHQSLEAARAVHEGALPADGLHVGTLGISEREMERVTELAASGTSAIDPVVAYLVGATSGPCMHT
ncbi:MAG: hypothetical protein OXT09_28580 [Myxococcales bacterium]|nr:hypothetical protein [Myxococcales bacterium]